MTDPDPQKLLTTPIPTNEAERLAALHRYKILDTPPEAAFDRITRLAARLFDMPIALISLVDESRAWFKSCVGFGANEVPRDDTLCSFAVLTDEPLIIPDARLDDRFACNPFVQAEPGVRFYAGAPLLSHDGFNLGTLCLLDSQPHDPLTPKQQATLVDLAAMVVDELELRLAAHRVVQVDAALLEVMQGVSAVTGNAFFPALVQHLTKALGMSYACISLLVNEHPEAVETIAFCAQGQITDNVEYWLQDTPCLEAIQQQKLCCYPQRVQALFPKDHFLASLSIESYAAIPFFDSTGKPLGLLSVMDGKPLENLQLVQALLTIFAVRIAAELERQQAAEHLQLYADVVRNAQIGVVVWQLEDLNDPGSFRLLIANPAASETTGFNFEPLIGRTMGEGFPMLLQSPLVHQYMEVVRDGQALDLGEVSYGEDGIAAGVYSLKAFPLPDRCLGLAFENITTRKRTEIQLQESQRYNQQVAEAMPGILFVHDLIEQRNVYTNRQITDFLGYTSEQVQGMGADVIPTLIHPDDLERVLRYFESFRSAPEDTVLEIEYQARHANGEWRWLHSQSVVFDRTAEGLAHQILGVAIDITARKQAEAALRNSEERFRTLADNMSQLAWMADETGWIFWYNQRWFDYTGTTLEEMQGWGWQQVHHSDQVDRVVKHFRHCLETGEQWEDTFPLRGRDGTYRWFLSRAIPIRDEQGRILRWFGTNTDITDRKQAETNLHDSETKLRLFIEQAPATVAMLDHEMRYLLVSQRWVDTYHLESIAAVIGRSHYDLFPNLPDHWIKIHQRCLTGESEKCEEDWFLLPDGSEQWLFWEIVPWYTSTGTVGGILIFVEDITSRKQTEIELRQKNAILDVINESAPTPIFVKDRQGRIIYANPATLEVLGKSAAEVIGYRDCDLYPNPKDAASVMENDRRIMELGQMEVVEESPDGIRTFLGMKVPYRNEAGEVIGLIGISNDITDRVQLERDRERILQQEQAARETAENANRIKDEFLAVLSHELRSPLNPILGWTRLLQNGKLDAARQHEALATIERNAKLQTQLIDDLLDISRIMQGKLSLTVTPVSLTFVITAAVETVRLSAEAKNIQILLDLPTAIAPVSGDAARLQQVVWNLLTNAVKFTSSGGKVTVELRQLDHFAQIRVTDTGKGIDPQFLPHVFEYFRQADATTTRKFGGLGLGLAIVKQIVEMHGGTVWAESEGENRGAIFTVQLPLSSQAPLRDSDASRDNFTTEAALSDLQILLVEDETDTREFQTFLLEQNGAKVTAVASGTEALQVLDQFIPDVMISDVGMAEMDGYMLMQQIRSRPPEIGGRIPAIALTAYARDFDQQKALQAGFQTHLSKPVEPEALVQAIICLCERNRGNAG
ncbi:PAS domain S-box protein [Oculatella sp. FACHB-28]|uniref:PAS domain S-box protein n=1 Tax=Oculatella sp. FACHB-28 TaxID=2692845 RepID=UPI0018EF6A94|nr:PAS domain S-box protein [Oculatella sp. FACHB-28]